MTTALAKAFASAEASYLLAKAAATPRDAEQLLASAPGVDGRRPDLAHSAEQLKHFAGWVYAAIRPIAQRIAGQPIRVGKVAKRGSVGVKAAAEIEPLESHPLLDLLADPNGLMVGWSLIYSTVASLELTGRCLWWLPKREQIVPIPSSWITAIQTSQTFDSFRVRLPYSAEEIDIPADECCYFFYPSPADPCGVLSPLQAAAAAVDLDEEITRSQVSTFARGIHPSHAIIVGRDPHPDVPGGMRPRLSPAQQGQIISAIRQRYGGTWRHGEPLILDGLIEDVKRLSNTPAEMDWQSSSELTKARILQGFGVNPAIIGELEGANRASAYVAERNFLSLTVNPKIELISQTLTEWLSPMFGGDIVVWVEPAVADDTETALQWATLLAGKGAITGDELRQLSPLGLKPGGFAEPVSAGAAPAKALGQLFREPSIPATVAADAVLKFVDRL